VSGPHLAAPFFTPCPARWGSLTPHMHVTATGHELDDATAVSTRPGRGPHPGALTIELRGNLAAMLSAAKNATSSPETGDLELQMAVVAGGQRVVLALSCSGASATESPTNTCRR
jgi:hypothetical protein